MMCKIEFQFNRLDVKFELKIFVAYKPKQLSRVFKARVKIQYQFTTNFFLPRQTTCSSFSLEQNNGQFILFPFVNLNKTTTCRHPRNPLNSLTRALFGRSLSLSALRLSYFLHSLFTVKMSLTELDDGLVRSMAIGAVFSDFVRNYFSRLTLPKIQFSRFDLIVEFAGREDTFGGVPQD